MRYLLSAIVLLGGLRATAPAAELWLEGERVTLDLSGDLNWTPSWAAYQGNLYQNGLASNSSVIRLTDVGFVGAVHRHEQLLAASLTVDGVPIEVASQTVAGREFRLERLLSLDDAYQVKHELALAGAEIRERFEFTGLDPARTVDVLYPAMASRVNSFTHWLTFDQAGAMLSEGLATADDESYTMFPKDTRAVALFDPASGIGTVVRWEVDGALGPRAFLWDRGTPPLRDNKVYLRLPGAEGPADRHFEVYQRTTLFESNADDWRYAALAWAAPTPGDVDGDGRVDLNDFGVLKANFGGSGLAVPGDLNHNGEVDLSDFGLLKDNFGRTPWPTAAVRPVPEPAAWRLAGIGALALVVLRRFRARRLSCCVAIRSSGCPPILARSASKGEPRFPGRASRTPGAGRTAFSASAPVGRSRPLLALRASVAEPEKQAVMQH